MIALAAELWCVPVHAEPWTDGSAFFSNGFCFIICKMEQGCRGNAAVVLCDSKISVP